MNDHLSTVDDELLRQYLAEALPAPRMAQVEKALRDSAELRDRLERVRQDRADPALHTLGAIWRRSRLTCLTREQLGSFLLDVLDPDLAGYVRFHVEVVECPFCRANLADLQTKAQPLPPRDQERRRRIFHSSRGLLSSGS
jgi:hypothetical protein